MLDIDFMPDIGVMPDIGGMLDIDFILDLDSYWIQIHTGNGRQHENASR